MRNIFLITFIAMLFVSCNEQQQESKNRELLTDKEVEEFIMSYDDMWARRDTSLMKETMSDNYIYFSSTGRTIDRKSIMDWFNPADKYKVDSVSRNEIKITIEGSTAIVSSRWVGRGSFGGEKFEDDQRCGLVIRKENGKLKILSEHCTQISK
jgi:ketosteroid isomerase-like protein